MILRSFVAGLVWSLMRFTRIPAAIVERNLRVTVHNDVVPAISGPAAVRRDAWPSPASPSPASPRVTRSRQLKPGKPAGNPGKSGTPSRAATP